MLLVLRPLYFDIPLSCPFLSYPVLSVLKEKEKEKEKEREKEKEKETAIPGYGVWGNAPAPISLTLSYRL